MLACLEGAFRRICGYTLWSFVMGKAKLILVLAIVALALAAGWQIVSCHLANAELQDDLNDLSAQSGAQIGLSAPTAEDDLRSAVIRRAKEHGIELTPEQVTVHHTVTSDASTVTLAVDYDARVNLLVYSFTLHFTPSSTKKIGIQSSP